MGLRSLSSPLAIGSRLANSGATTYDNQFYGSIDEVAVYNKALTTAQVQSHYLVAGVPPVITQINPFNLDTNQNSTVAFRSRRCFNVVRRKPGQR